MQVTDSGCGLCGWGDRNKSVAQSSFTEPYEISPEQNIRALPKAFHPALRHPGCLEEENAGVLLPHKDGFNLQPVSFFALCPWALLNDCLLQSQTADIPIRALPLISHVASDLPEPGASF